MITEREKTKTALRECNLNASFSAFAKRIAIGRRHRERQGGQVSPSPTGTVKVWESIGTFLHSCHVLIHNTPTAPVTVCKFDKKKASLRY